MNELPSSAIGTLRLMPSKASEVAQFSRQLIVAVQSGEVNPLELLVMLRSLEAVSELVREEIEENILTEAGKFSEKVIERFGARIERCDTYTKYIYETSKDSEWSRMDTELRDLQHRMKEREKFLRALSNPMTVVDQDSGEITEIRPPVKKSKEGVKVYLGNIK